MQFIGKHKKWANGNGQFILLVSLVSAYLKSPTIFKYLKYLKTHDSLQIWFYQILLFTDFESKRKQNYLLNMERKGNFQKQTVKVLVKTLPIV